MSHLPKAPFLLLAAALALGVGAAVSFWPSRPPDPQPVVLALPEVPAPPALSQTRLALRRGETLGELTGRAGLTDADAHGLLAALSGRVDARRVRPGQALVVSLTGSGRLVRAAFEAGAVDVVDVVRAGEAFTADRREVALETSEARVSVRVDSSLWGAFEAAGEDPALAVLASDILAYELDFYRDVRPGDRMDLVVRKVTHDGKRVRYGDILAVRYTSGGTAKTFYRFERGGEAGYFDGDGRSVKRAFLRQPLPLVRITSRFGNRLHPVLGYWKQHAGVDYGAPTGTPVWAVGDGVVTWAGRKGPNGNLVSLRHANGFVSHYAHLSRLGAGVRVGSRVGQKQVIGFVGATGRATGPHLHFALSKGGAFVNPLGQKFPAGEPICAAARAGFAAAVAPLALELDGAMMATRDP